MTLVNEPIKRAEVKAKYCRFKKNGIKYIDYKDGEFLKKFINEHHLQGWHHAWQNRDGRIADEQAGVANFRQLFDVYQTPTMYLLDADKRIIAKKLSLEQYDAVIEAKLKTKTSTQ